MIMLIDSIEDFKKVNMCGLIPTKIRKTNVSTAFIGVLPCSFLGNVAEIQDKKYTITKYTAETIQALKVIT